MACGSGSKKPKSVNIRRNITSTMGDNAIKNILIATHNIAVVGLSADPQRPSFQVANYLKSQGYRIFPVNPKCVTVLSEPCYANLAMVKETLLPGESIDIVDIFRRPEFVLPHIEEAIQVGVKVIWMQEGVEHKEAAAKAQAAGLTVIMNTCLMKTHQRLFKI